MIGSERPKKAKKDYIKPKNLASHQKTEDVGREKLTAMLLDDLNQPVENQFVQLREEDKVRQGYKNALVQLAANLGHAPKDGHLDPLDASYVPSDRWRQAIDDLHGLLVLQDNAAPPEPLLECLADTMHWERHLCPLLIAIEPKHALRLVQCMAAINGPLADLSDPAEHLHRRRVWKKTMMHPKLQHKLVALLVWALEVPNGNRADCQLLIRTTLTLLRNCLSCPDLPPPQPAQQDRLLKAMQDSQLLELLGLALASLLEWPFADLFPLLLEISSLLFNWIHPESLKSDISSLSIDSSPSLPRPIRHSRFMGTICVQMEDGKQRVYNQARFHELTQDALDLRRKRTIPQAKVSLLDWPRLVVGSGIKRLMETCVQNVMPHLPLLMDRVEEDEPSLGFIDQFHCSWLRLAAWLLTYCTDHSWESLLPLLPITLMQREIRQLRRWQEGKSYAPIMACMLYLKAAITALLQMEQNLEYASMARSMLANLLLCDEAALAQIRNCSQIGEKRAGICFHRTAIEVNGLILSTLHHLSLHPGTLSVRIYGLQEAEGEEGESAVSRFTEFTKTSREERYQVSMHLYCHLPILIGFIPSLRRWDQNSVALNQHLACLMEAIQMTRPALLWRVSVMHAMQRILRGPLAMRTKHPRLCALAEQVCASFMQQLALKPLLLLQAFFPPTLEVRTYAEPDEVPEVGGFLSTLPLEQQIRQLVRRLVEEEELSALVGWLKSHVENAILDPHEYILIAETTAQRRALGNFVMQQLLRVIGADPPSKKLILYLDRDRKSWMLNLDAEELHKLVSYLNSAIQDATRQESSTASEDEGINIDEVEEANESHEDPDRDHEEMEESFPMQAPDEENEEATPGSEENLKDWKSLAMMTKKRPALSFASDEE